MTSGSAFRTTEPGQPGLVSGVLRLLVELIAIVLVSVVLISSALALIPGLDDAAWSAKVSRLILTGLTLHFTGAWAEPSAFIVIGRAAIISLAIIGSTTAILVAIGVPLGILSVTHSRSVAVRICRRIVSTVSSVPVLVLGTLLFVMASKYYHVTLRDEVTLSGAMLAAVVTLSFGDRLLIDIVSRVELATRAVLAEPYMRAVRAANFGVRRHLLQSLVPPVAEAITSRAMFLISGAIVAEIIFTVHGLGYTVEHTLAVYTGSDDQDKILASAMALIAIGLCFRIAHRAAVSLADPRRRA